MTSVLSTIINYSRPTNTVKIEENLKITDLITSTKLIWNTTCFIKQINFNGMSLRTSVYSIKPIISWISLFTNKRYVSQFIGNLTDLRSLIASSLKPSQSREIWSWSSLEKHLTTFVCLCVQGLAYKVSSLLLFYRACSLFTKLVPLSVCNEYNFEDKNLFYRFKEDDCGSEQGPPGTSVPLAGEICLDFKPCSLVRTEIVVWQKR